MVATLATVEPAHASAVPGRRLPRGVMVALITLIALAAVAGSHAGRVGVKTLLVMPEALPDPPARPLLWVTQAPQRLEFTFESGAGPVEADLYLPAAGGRRGAIILYTGAFGLRRDASFVQVAEALARAGAVVLVPESASLRSGELRAEEVDTILMSLALLRSRPEVDHERIGVAGFSVGGSLALLAAEDEIGREQIAFLNVFGAYYDARETLRAVAGHQIELDGQTVAWEPMEVSTYIFRRQLIRSLPDDRDQFMLEQLFLDAGNLDEARWPEDGAVTQLSPEAQIVRALFRRPSPGEVDRLLAALPPDTQAGLGAISPSARVDRLKTRLYVMHGVADRHIPIIEGRRLSAAVGPGVLRRHTELRLFEHVRADQDLAPLVLVVEFWRLYRHLWIVAQEFL